MQILEIKIITVMENKLFPCMKKVN